jgi:hypothetical protein
VLNDWSSDATVVEITASEIEEKESEEEVLNDWTPFAGKDTPGYELLDNFKTSNQPQSSVEMRYWEKKQDLYVLYGDHAEIVYHPVATSEWSKIKLAAKSNSKVTPGILVKKLGKSSKWTARKFDGELLVRKWNVGESAPHGV